MTDQPNDWACVMCGAASPDRLRSCSCPTGVLFSKAGKTTAWKADAPQASGPPTIERQIACLRREIALRKNVYPGWVRSKRMKPDEAKEEIDAMQAAHDVLMSVKEGRLVSSKTIGEAVGAAMEQAGEHS